MPHVDEHAEAVRGRGLDQAARRDEQHVRVHHSVDRFDRRSTYVPYNLEERICSPPRGLGGRVVVVAVREDLEADALGGRARESRRNSVKKDVT